MVIVAPPYDGRSVAVLGLARSGLAAARALEAGGTQVLCWDDDPLQREAAINAGLRIASPAEIDWAGVGALVPSPGVPLDHPMVAAAKVADIEVVGDAELLWRAVQAPRYVGVTGTNGKSTTTALIGHILRKAQQSIQVGGNLGAPALSLDPLWADGTYVLEMSSYQLDLTKRMSFDVAVLLNIAPDHLDRHGSMEAYVAAKRKIFRPALLETAVLGIDDPTTQRIYDELVTEARCEVVSVAVGRLNDNGVAVIDGRLYDQGDEICDLAQAPALPGAHNWQNAGAAYATARALAIDASDIVSAIRDFPGLPHRMERVATVDGVLFVNDSKATNAEAAARALACHENVYWIVGGRAKEGGISALEHHFPRVAHAFLIGEAEDQFSASLEGKVSYSRCGDLETAVAEATQRAQANGRATSVVLLSPACASFDQFSDFEARGEAFRHLVLEHQARACQPVRRCSA